MNLPIARKFSFWERSQISHKNDVEIRLRLYLQKDFPPHVFEEPSPQIPHLSCPVHLEQEYSNQIMTFCWAGFFFFWHGTYRFAKYCPEWWQKHPKHIHSEIVLSWTSFLQVSRSNAQTLPKVSKNRPETANSYSQLQRGATIMKYWAEMCKLEYF